MKACIKSDLWREEFEAIFIYILALVMLFDLDFDLWLLLVFGHVDGQCGLGLHRRILQLQHFELDWLPWMHLFAPHFADLLALVA